MSAEYKKQETKEEVKSEKIVPAQTGETAPQVNVLRSEFDAFISDRIRSGPKTIEEVEVQVLEKPKEGRHELSLPEELEAYTKKYAFCWIFKRKKSIDQACSLLHWVICTRSHFSEEAKKYPHLFSANGAIERGDEILMFRSRAIDDEMRKAPGTESAQLIKQRTEAHTNDPAFYVPKSEEFDLDPKTGKRVKVPIVGV